MLEKPNHNPQATLVAEISNLENRPLFPWSRHLESELVSKTQKRSADTKSDDATSMLIGLFPNCLEACEMGNSDLMTTSWSVVGLPACQPAKLNQLKVTNSKNGQLS